MPKRKQQATLPGVASAERYYTALPASANIFRQQEFLPPPCVFYATPTGDASARNRCSFSADADAGDADTARRAFFSSSTPPLRRRRFFHATRRYAAFERRRCYAMPRCTNIHVSRPPSAHRPTSRQVAAVQFLQKYHGSLHRLPAHSSSSSGSHVEKVDKHPRE